MVFVLIYARDIGGRPIEVQNGALDREQRMIGLLKQRGLLARDFGRQPLARQPLSERFQVPGGPVEDAGSNHQDKGQDSRKSDRDPTSKVFKHHLRMLTVRFARKSNREIADRFAEIVANHLTDNDISKLLDAPAVILDPVAYRFLPGWGNSLPDASAIGIEQRDAGGRKDLERQDLAIARLRALDQILNDANICERQAKVDIRLYGIPELGEEEIDIGFNGPQAEPIKAAIDECGTEHDSHAGDGEEGQDDPRAGRHGLIGRNRKCNRSPLLPETRLLRTAILC